MKTLLGWLFGTVTARVTGAQPEDFLNLCARENLILWKMLQRDRFTLEVQVTARQFSRLAELARRAGFELDGERRRGLPYFLLGFRRRYALLAGLAVCLVLFGVGARTVLTIDVTGNESLTKEEIISQLRLCGVSVGTYAPDIPVREVENHMMLAMDQLSYLALNLHGTRAEVIVREKDPAPELRAERVPTDVIASASGVITHMEPWVGDARFQEGDAVLKGDILISGHMQMDIVPQEWEEEGPVLGEMLVHAEGKVLARTWHKLTAQISLTAPTKGYTGEKTTRYSLSVMGKRVKFYQNSGISYENYDTITELKSWTPIPGKTLPVVWEKETHRAYEISSVALDPAAAEELLRQKLLASLEEQMDQGKVLQTDYTVTRQGDLLQVTLLAQCDEQIGRITEMDTQEKVVGPRHPAPGTTGADEKAQEGETPSEQDTKE